MPNPTRRTIALAVLAAAIIAGAVALDLPSAAAQSDDEQAGRIVARRLADDRIEFGWQPSGDAPVLPRARYFPADAPRDGVWLRSSPVEVDGVELGRINARLSYNGGQIEFAFRPINRERILPPLRYFPRNARIGRWLRSTEITISAASAIGFVAVSAGSSHTCGLHESGVIECWGRYDSGQTDAPAGSFTAVSAGGEHTCAIRAGSGAIECWGSNAYTQTDAPAGSFTAVAAGDRHTCAIRAGSGAIECWGSNAYGQVGAPTSSFTAGSFTAAAAGDRHTCAIRAGSGQLECWGRHYWDWGGDRRPAP